MSDPVVQLPPDHWIVRQFESWQKSEQYQGLFHADQMTARFLWVAFAAGAQSIPGNPERIAELERVVDELRAEGQEVRLCRAEDQIEALQVRHENLCACHDTLEKNFLGEMKHWKSQLTAFDQRMSIIERRSELAPVLIFANNHRQGSDFSHSINLQGPFRIITHPDQIRGMVVTGTLFYKAGPLEGLAAEAWDEYRNRP